MVLSDKSLGLLFVDIQEKLFDKILNKESLLKKLALLFEAVPLLHIPMFLSEQYPQGLGVTVDPLSAIRPKFEKTAFSCLGDEVLKKALLMQPVSCWIVVGIETHVCILQTAKDLLEAKKEVIIPVDAVSSRNLLDTQVALQTLSSLGASLTTCETLLFELLVNAKHPQFKAISRLIK